MPHFETVFDISQYGYAWWWPAIGFIPILIGLVSKSSFKKIFFILFGISSASLVFITTYKEYANLQQSFSSGEYKIVEGTIENFQEIRRSGTGKDGPIIQEAFSVNGIPFDIEGYVETPAFHYMTSQGGPIHLGDYARISYLEKHTKNISNPILKIEIRKQ